METNLIDSPGITAHYERMLSLRSPWKVKAIGENIPKWEIRVIIGHEAVESFPCPECGELCPVHDHTPIRHWKHLTLMQYKLLIECEVPRCNCKKHGIKEVKVPWAEENCNVSPLSRFIANLSIGR